MSENQNMIQFSGEHGSASKINYNVPMPGSHTGKRLLKLEDLDLSKDDWLEEAYDLGEDYADEVGAEQDESTGKWQIDPGKALDFWKSKIEENTGSTEALDEINFGVSVADALKNLARRIDCPDLKFFVVSVILQRETGGNLAEIIDSIAYIIRERFKLKGKIRSLSAEGRLSGVILVLIPFIVVFALRFINANYINTLLTEPAGRIMAIVGATMMFFGIIVIKKMIQIKI